MPPSSRLRCWCRCSASSARGGSPAGFGGDGHEGARRRRRKHRHHAREPSARPPARAGNRRGPRAEGARAGAFRRARADRAGAARCADCPGHDRGRRDRSPRLGRVRVRLPKGRRRDPRPPAHSRLSRPSGVGAGQRDRVRRPLRRRCESRRRHRGAAGSDRFLQHARDRDAVDGAGRTRPRAIGRSGSRLRPPVRGSRRPGAAGRRQRREPAPRSSARDASRRRCGARLRDARGWRPS